MNKSAAVYCMNKSAAVHHMNKSAAMHYMDKSAMMHCMNKIASIHCQLGTPPKWCLYLLHLTYNLNPQLMKYGHNLYLAIEIAPSKIFVFIDR